MPSSETLGIAVARGIITEAQANSIQMIEDGIPRHQGAANTAAATTDDDDEGFRFVTGFSDIFLAIGVGIVIYGALQSPLWQSAVGNLVLAGLCWGLSEIVATWQRRSLPSIIASIAFVAFSVVAALSYFAGVDPMKTYLAFDLALEEIGQSKAWVLPACILGASALYYFRFRLPFSLFMMAIGFAATVGISLFRVMELDFHPSMLIAVLFVTGLIIFAAAFYFDTQDTKRQTRLSDNAFWLLLIASPLMVHSIMWQAAIWTIGSDRFSTQGLESAALPLAIVVLAIFVILVAIALIIDRRALLVSSLIYVTVAIGYLAKNTEGYLSTAAFVPILIGTGILALGIGWRACRSFMFTLFPLDRITPYVPPVTSQL